MVSSGTGSRPRSMPTNCRIPTESYNASSTPGSDGLNHLPTMPDLLLFRYLRPGIPTIASNVIFNNNNTYGSGGAIGMVNDSSLSQRWSRVNRIARVNFSCVSSEKKRLKDGAEGRN